MADERIDQIRARRDRAGRGPWKYPHRGFPGVVTSPHGCLWNPNTGRINDEADAEFIAHSRVDIDFLLSEYDRQDAVLSKVMELYEKFCDGNVGTGWSTCEVELFVEELRLALEGGEA